MVSTHWRPLAFALAAAAFCFHGALAQDIAERVQQCSVCHGEDGNSRMPNVPSIAGQPQYFLATQLVLVREGVRKIEGMSPLLKGLKDEEIVAIAKHFAALEAKPSDEQIDPALVKRGEALAGPMRCDSCHLPTLVGQDQTPRLAKQRVDYLIHALKQFRDDTRSGADTLMSNVVAGVSDADLAALAHYAASR
ncbi:MAG: c-type cytochrome [Xanthobacteraceae bacterium]